MKHKSPKSWIKDKAGRSLAFRVEEMCGEEAGDIEVRELGVHMRNDRNIITTF